MTAGRRKSKFVQRLVRKARQATSTANELLDAVASGSPMDTDTREFAVLWSRDLVDGSGRVTEAGRRVAARIVEAREEARRDAGDADMGERERRSHRDP